MFKYLFYFYLVLFFSKASLAMEQKIVWAKTIANKTNTKFHLNYYSDLTPFYYNKSIIIASSSGHISSFNPSTGWRNWTKFIKKERFYFAKKKKNVLYLGSLTGMVFAFNLKTKTILWKKLLPEQFLYKAAIYKNQLLLLSPQGQLLSINKNTSQILWSKKIFTANKQADLIDIRKNSKNALFVYKRTLYIKYSLKLLAFNLRSKKVQWKKRYRYNLKQAKYFSKPLTVWINHNKKRYLAGNVLKEKKYIYLYTQANSLIKVLVKK
ncbi:MAG: PQQ-like beta-propeller repeat protein [Bdellovibrionaceae bacterium]|nr:PQQ-like beta-propeller repeat protein [Pseudobdellovibrionaceae bacterium]